MTPEQIKTAQEKFLQLQSQIQETVVAEDSSVIVTMNGQMQITYLLLPADKSSEELSTLTMQTINSCIQKLTKKIQAAMFQTQQELK